MYQSKLKTGSIMVVKLQCIAINSTCNYIWKLRSVQKTESKPTHRPEIFPVYQFFLAFMFIIPDKFQGNGYFYLKSWMVTLINCMDACVWTSPVCKSGHFYWLKYIHFHNRGGSIWMFEMPFSVSIAILYA